MPDADWIDFDASKPSLSAEKALRERTKQFLKMSGVIDDDPDKIYAEAIEWKKSYDNGQAPILNHPVHLEIFRPNEFRHITENDHAILEFAKWLAAQKNFEWRKSSTQINSQIRAAFPSAGKLKISNSQFTGILDAFIRLDGRCIAVELEASNNFDNGFRNLQHSVYSQMAHCGVMIVPWTARSSNRINEQKARGSVDLAFETVSNASAGPIYVIGIARWIDICNRIIASRPKSRIKVKY